MNTGSVNLLYMYIDFHYRDIGYHNDQTPFTPDTRTIDLLHQQTAH